MKKIILTLMCIATLGFANTQTRYSTTGFESSEWNDDLKKYINPVYRNDANIFQFYDEYTKFGIIGNPNLDWTVTNITVENDVITFTGLDKLLEEYIFMIDYKIDMIKMLFTIDGETYLFMYNIVAYKEY
jgi:hypothetical protein